MFGWKRHRKEDPTLECAALGRSPAAAVCDAGAAGLPNDGSSAASSECSEMDEELAEYAEATSSSMHRGIEMATHAPKRQPGNGAAVRSKAAYYEAMIQCSDDSLQQQCGGASGLKAHIVQLDSDGDEGEAVALAGSSWQEAGCLGGDGDEEVEGGGVDYSEVHLVLRIPRRREPQQPTSGKYGSQQDMEALIEQLQEAVVVRERQHKAALAALARRSAETDNLRGVVRELTESRSKAVSQRAALAEKYAELQQEYHRMLRIADLSRTVSKENMAQTSRTRSELRRVQLELHATRSQAQSLTEKHKKVRVENAKLKEKVTLLERLDLESTCESEVKKHYTRFKVMETY